MIVCQFKTHWILTNVKLVEASKSQSKIAGHVLVCPLKLRVFFLWIIKGTLVRKRLKKF